MSVYHLLDILSLKKYTRSLSEAWLSKFVLVYIKVDLVDDHQYLYKLFFWSNRKNGCNLTWI